MRIKSGTTLCAVGAVLLAACQPALKQADMIFSNGAVYTANAAHDVQEVVDFLALPAASGGHHRGYSR